MPPSPAQPNPLPASGRDTPIGLLADPVNAVIISTLGERRAEPLTAPALAERELVGVAPRLVRDRMRQLERHGIVAATDHETAGTSKRSRWALTVAGRDLFSLQSVMTRIVTHAARLPAAAAPDTRHRLVSRVLSELADPIVIALLRALAAGPAGPTTLEDACAPTPRRTLYRRLGTLVDAGVVRRTTTHEVPRRTSYELDERWRPVVSILLLSAWWEWRHAGTQQSAMASDLEGLLLGIMPLVRVARPRQDSCVRFVVAADDHEGGMTLRCQQARLVPAGDAATPTATVAGHPSAWASALVNDRREELAFSGDAALAGEFLSAVRGAVLAYVR